MKYFSILTCLLITFSINVSARKQEKLNVLFIISDDLAATALSSYGNKIVQTPNIDQLASQGVCFTRTYSQYTVCGPSRVPLIIKAPGIKPKVTNSLTELIDLYPTVADLAGLEYEKDLQGKSLVKTLKNPDHSVRDVAFSMHRRHGKFSFMLRSDKWAYIQYDEDGESGMELYDMENDPNQYNNLAHNPQYHDVVKKFRQRLKEKLRNVRDNDLEIKYKTDD